MTLEHDLDADPKLKPGARRTMEQVAETVQNLAGIPNTHLEIETSGTGSEGTDRLKITVKSDLAYGGTLAETDQPI